MNVVKDSLYGEKFNPTNQVNGPKKQFLSRLFDPIDFSQEQKLYVQLKNTIL